MWFVFPQLRSLGHSLMAEFYGLSSLAEARAYLAHPVLGPRLILCTETVLPRRPYGLSWTSRKPTFATIEPSSSTSPVRNREMASTTLTRRLASPTPILLDTSSSTR